MLYIMKTSNISYLRNHLSEVLNCVREGESVLVLDRNKPVARLVPFSSGEASMTRRMRELQQSGLLAHRPDLEPVPLPPPIGLERPVDLSRIIMEDRGRV
jgi:prevent-host-death family protein